MTIDVKGKLIAGETFWRDHYEFLRSAGYTLRPRYKPDWSPSWKTTPDATFRLTEDSIASAVRYINLITLTETNVCSM